MSFPFPLSRCAWILLWHLTNPYITQRYFDFSCFVVLKSVYKILCNFHFEELFFFLFSPLQVGHVFMLFKVFALNMSQLPMDFRYKLLFNVNVLGFVNIISSFQSLALVFFITIIISEICSSIFKSLSTKKCEKRVCKLNYVSRRCGLWKCFG